jgi:hypothetical protein
MTSMSNRDAVHDPQQLAPTLVARERAGDVDGMVMLYEQNAILHCGNGCLAVGREAIRAFYSRIVAEGRVFEVGEQRPAIVNDGIALTSTRLPDGSVTAEVARRGNDGSWLWVIDQPRIATGAAPAEGQGSAAS